MDIMFRTFKKGGILLKDEKDSKENPIEMFPIPEVVYLPLIQHLGLPAKAIVKVNEKVKTGQLIAKAEGLISANIHSPVTGTVVRIEEIPDINNIKRSTIIINSEPDDWVDSIVHSTDHIEEIKFSKEEILKKIFDAGIVGLGGATFPSHIKLSVPLGKKVHTLIINGNECEPYITSDYRLMIEKTAEIITGIKILMKVLDISNAIIGIEDNKPGALNAFQNLLKDQTTISLKKLKTRYPQGSEKHLILALIKKEVPSGKLPLDIGVVVHNVATVFSVYEAVQKNKPLIERVITVTGKSIPASSNYIIRMGTPLSSIIQKAGGIPSDTGKIIFGGPMMGKAAHSIDLPVTKGTNCILFLPKADSERKIHYNCIRCRSCVRVCPMGLSPYLLSMLIENDNYEYSEKESILDCIECGCCSYSCPSGVPINENIRDGKTKVNLMIRQRNNLRK
jgi:Na+-translocating ferredoxin:NAD+ oxidoreductase subunit C